MLNLSTPEIQFAMHAARQAALLARQVQAELGARVLPKQDRSPVTVADFASQALVSRLLAQAFPNDPLVAEESSAALRQPEQAHLLEQVCDYVSRTLPGVDIESVCAWIDRGAGAPGRRFWTLDPIDGTKGFLRGDQYVVALALLADGQVQAAALGCPNLSEARRPEPGGPGSLVLACRGEGAWSTSLEEPGQFQRLHISPQTEPRQMVMLRSLEAEHTNVALVDQLARWLEVQTEAQRMDSQAKYIMVAAGAGELLLRPPPASQPGYHSYLWDVAAGALVVEEAGGRLSDLDGKALDFTAGRRLQRNRGVVASNGWLHTAILNAIGELGI